MNTGLTAEVRHGVRTTALWLHEVYDDPALGGKAWGLVRLIRAGLPVPVGFVLRSHLLPPARALSGEPVTAADLPDGVVDALTAAYAELGRKLGEPAPLVAVRSSALAEDLSQASFAGQYVTVLGARGEQELLDAVARCWASLGAPGVASYRAAVEAKIGVPLPEPGMGVLVQALVDADAAGVAETVDPITGSDATVIVRAAWGVGRTVVDGLTEPDTFRVDRATLTVTELHAGTKTQRAGLGPDATPAPVEADRQRMPCLSLAEAAEVAGLALKAEAVLGGPADVEWAIAGGTLWLLQARPLIRGVAPSRTAADEAEPSRQPQGTMPAFPFVWPDAETATVHWQQRADDARVFEVLTPFELDMRALNNRSVVRAQMLTGAADLDQIFEVNGYLYNGKRPAPGTEAERAALAEAVLRPKRVLHTQGDTFFEKAVIPAAEDAVSRLGLDPDSLATPDLADHFHQVLDWYEEAWVLHMTMDPFDATSPVGRAATLYTEITGDDNRWAISAPFRHIPQKGHEMVDGLVALAQNVKASPALRKVFEASDPEQVLDGIEGLEGAEAFRDQMDGLLAEHGLQSGASQGIMRSQVMPGWREQPSLVVALVQRYLAQDLDMLTATRHRSKAQYAEDVEKLMARVAEAATTEQRAGFEFWFDAARRQVTCMVNHNFYLDGPMNAMLHWALTACGRRLAAAGVLDDPADVWYLRAYQVEAAVRRLGAPDQPDWRMLVAAQKMLADWQRSLIPPSYLGAPPAPEKPKEKAGEPEDLPANLLLKGRAASPGVATGRVRLVDYRALVPDVRPGDVLVAGDCGVLWASLLPVATAVVLDGSFPGEHPMRVCTEFGVPGIVQAKHATKLLREGQLVTVDGTRGWVLDAER